MLTIHGVPISVHTRKAILTAKLKGIAFENQPVIPFDPPPDWRSLSPTGLIPALTHDGYSLADSNAICGYLERLAGAPAIYPENAKVLGKALWLEQYATTVLFRRVVHPLFFQKVIRPGILEEGPPDEAELRRVRDDVVPEVFGYLDHHWDGPAFGGDAPTVGDIAIVCNLINYRYLGFGLDGSSFPALAQRFNTALGHATVAAVLDAERPFVEKMGLDGSFLN